MKRLLLILLLCAASASAADIDFTINGEALKDSYTLTPGEKFTFNLRLAPGVLVRNVEVEADKNYYETLFENNFNQRYSRSPREETKMMSLDVPSETPSGESGLEVTIHYEDKEFNKRTETYKTTINIEKGSKMTGFLLGLVGDQTEDEIMAEMGMIQVKQKDKKLTYDDLTKEDYNKLGLTFEDLAQGNAPQIEETSSKEEKQSFDEKFEQYGLGGGEHPEVTVTRKTFNVKYGEVTLPKTKFHVSVPAQDLLSELRTVVIIPKEIAQSTDELQFDEEPEIIEKDPVVKWAFNVVPEGQAKEYTIVLDKETDLDIEAGAAADSKGLMTRFVTWLIGLFT